MSITRKKIPETTSSIPTAQPQAAPSDAVLPLAAGAAVLMLGAGYSAYLSKRAGGAAAAKAGDGVVHAVADALKAEAAGPLGARRGGSVLTGSVPLHVRWSAQCTQVNAPPACMVDPQSLLPNHYSAVEASRLLKTADKKDRLAEELRPFLPHGVDPAEVMATVATGAYWKHANSDIPILPKDDDNVARTPTQVQILTGPITSGVLQYDLVTVGGLEALTRAERCLAANPHARVLYVNSGDPKIASKSGGQWHEHPSQWDGYGTGELVEIQLTTREPLDVKYEPLDMEIKSISDLVNHLRFTLQFINVRLFGNKVDHDLVNRIKASIDYYEQLDQKIFAATGKHIGYRGGRFYVSTSQAEIAKKKGAWEGLQIPVQLMKPEELASRTLFDPSITPYGLFMPKDGRMEADADKTIVDYLLQTYPHRFVVQQATVQQVVVNPTANACEIAFKDSDQKILAGRSFLSLGTGQIYADGKLLTKLTPVAGWTLNFEHHLSAAEVAKVCKGGSYQAFYQQQCGVADCHNLHVTPMGYKEHADGSVTVYTRVTQGGNFNKWIAHPDHLRNLLFKVQKFIGPRLGTLVSIGSCARQTGVSNAADKHYYPIRAVGSGSADAHAPAAVVAGTGNAGVGVSTSGTPPQSADGLTERQP